MLRKDVKPGTLFKYAGMARHDTKEGTDHTYLAVGLDQNGDRAVGKQANGGPGALSCALLAAEVTLLAPTHQAPTHQFARIILSGLTDEVTPLAPARQFAHIVLSGLPFAETGYLSGKAGIGYRVSPAAVYLCDSREAAEATVGIDDAEKDIYVVEIFRVERVRKTATYTRTFGKAGL